VLTELTASGLAALLRAREVSACDVVQAFLDRIDAVNPKVRAYLSVRREMALAEADLAQSSLDRGEGGPLTGVPVAVKDNICTKDWPTTCASRILEGWSPPYDATVVAKLAEAGAPVLGKVNLDEFAMGASTGDSAFHPTHNPWDLGRSPGGSSGGSAAAVAAGLAPLALGSDTGGSVRQPAALCGVVGFKPTYGRVSRYGLVAYASSLDQIGPLGRTVEDVALLAEAISGHDPRDATSLPEPPIASRELQSGSLRGLRAAMPRELFDEDAIEPGVLRAVTEAVGALRREGMECEEVSLPAIKFGVTTYYIIAPAEASSNLARFDGVRYGRRIEGRGHAGDAAATRGSLLGHEVKQRIMIGTYALSAGYYDAYYLRAQQVRALMANGFEATLREYDVILSPASPVVAFRHGERSADPLAMKLIDFCTIPANMGGFPAISIPCGQAGGLPVGLQLLGPVCSDERLLQIAWAAERALPKAPQPSIA
jgi:aspartyl-tRNA(Asn)/glutamyl-tRNA(Gln) amidotransferase subunit A